MLKPTQDGKVPVLMGLASEDGFPHQGYVNFIDNHLDLNTATLQVHGVFDNAQALEFCPACLPACACRWASRTGP